MGNDANSNIRGKNHTLQHNLCASPPRMPISYVEEMAKLECPPETMGSKLFKIKKRLKTFELITSDKFLHSLSDSSSEPMDHTKIKLLDQ